MPDRHSLIVDGQIVDGQIVDGRIVDGRTWAEVSLSALAENFHVVQKHVGPGVTICAVVKDARYGHGAVECSRALELAGAEWLGVTDAAEGLALRGAGGRSRILLD